MTFPTRSLALLLAAAPLLLGCDKDDTGSLDGSVPNAAFTVQLDTSKYPVVATFTATNQDGFLSQWDFGDGSSAQGQSVQHTYTRAGQFTVKLIVAGKGGTGISPVQTISVPSACDLSEFGALTGCATGSNRAWTYSTAAGAIKRLDAAGNVLSESAAGSLPACQADDEFTFTNSFNYSYNSAGATYNGTTCSTALDHTSTFEFRPATGGGHAQIVLLTKGAFIGLPDSVVNKTYDILQADSTVLQLQGTNPDGTRTVVTLRQQLSGADRAKELLTGGSSKTWVLNNVEDAPIVVGTEANPAQYFPGVLAGQLPTCQSDDEYTFTNSLQFTYAPGAETYVGIDMLQASHPQVYACQGPRPSTSVMNFGPPTTGSGLAEFTFVNPQSFIGVTDLQVPTAHYRILSITPTDMVLRGTTGSTDPAAAVFTIKFKAK